MKMNSDTSKIPSTDIEWEKLIATWIEAQRSGGPKSDHDPDWWPIDTVGDWTIDGLHEPLWEFIQRAFERKMTDKAFGILAAGPLEDLLATFGESYIDRVEELARRNPRFNSLLGGVWKNSMTDEVWRRVEVVRKEVW